MKKLLNNFIYCKGNYLINSLTRKKILISSKTSLYKKNFFLKGQERECIENVLFKTPTIIHLIIIPTWKCGLSCNFCYVKNNILSVNEKELCKINSKNITKFLYNYLIENPLIKNIYITFLGGEALLKPKVCLNILKDIDNFCKNRKIKLISSISTSLYVNLNQDIINLIKMLNHIAVSIDGNQKTHDLYRIPTINFGKSPFQVTIKNLQQIIKFGYNKNKISIRGCLDSTDIKNKSVVSDYYFILNHVLKIPFKNISLGIKFPYLLPLNNKEKQYYNKNILKNYYRTNPCCSYRYNKSFIINPNGDIYTNYYDIVENSKIGNIKSNIKEILYNYKQYIIKNMPILQDNKCIKCKYLAICWGGCSRENIIHKNEPSKYCDKNVKRKQMKKYIESL